MAAWGINHSPRKGKAKSKRKQTTKEEKFSQAFDASPLLGNKA
jgi:hypothetical protein